MPDDGERKGFRSFQDLRRARSGDAAPDAAEAQTGWTLESEGRRLDPDASLASVPDGGGREAESARERIARRPAAFGPMDHGPPMYADVDSEEMQLLASFRVRTVFPDDVRAETRALPTDPGPADWADRVDLRDETIFTIDGDDAKDFDDAISIAPLGAGRVKVGVHIADVGHYVRPGTALDTEALARGTSVYLPDQVVPMLPEALSNELCSLVPRRDRLAYSVHMVFDERGKRLSAEVEKTVIQSVQRNTYRIVQELLDGADTGETRAIRFIEGPLRLFREWTVMQQKLRDAKGSLRIQSRERKFVFDANHAMTGVVDAPRYFSNTLIEETALAANQAVGDLFRARGLPTVYRVHPEKDDDEIAAVAKSLEEHGIRVPLKERLTGRDIGRLILAARRRPNAEALIARIMGLVERAYYEVRDHEDVAVHFGLAREAYLHFTSPIRRYPDLLVHRWLWAIESRGGEAEAELKTEAFLADLNDMAAHCSRQAEIAEMAEYAVGDLKVCQLMEPHIGLRLDARILRVSRFGIEVVLTAFNVNGFLPVRAIGDRAELKGATLTVRAGRRNFSFTEGYPIRVLVKDVDFLRLQVLLEPG